MAEEVDLEDAVEMDISGTILHIIRHMLLEVEEEDMVVTEEDVYHI